MFLGAAFVTGRATLHAHADKLYLFASMAPVAGTSDDIDGAAAAVVVALTRLYAEDVIVTASVIPGTPAVGRAITATSADPTFAALNGLTRSIADAVKPNAGSVLENITLAPGLAQCAAVEAQVQMMAIADARSHAGRLADAAGATLGTPTVITPGGLPGYAFPCRPSRMIGRVDANALPADGNVEFGLIVNVTYPIVTHP